MIIHFLLNGRFNEIPLEIMNFYRLTKYTDLCKHYFDPLNSKIRNVHYNKRQAVGSGKRFK